MREKWEMFNEDREMEKQLGEELVNSFAWTGVFPETVVRFGGETVSAEMLRIKVGGRKGRGHMERMWALDISQDEEERRVLLRYRRDGWKYHRIEMFDVAKSGWLRVLPAEAVKRLSGWIS